MPTNEVELLRPANYDERQQTTAGQKDDVSDYDLELKDGEDSELPWVTKVTDPLEDFADAGENGRNAAGYDLRVLANEAGLEDVTTNVPWRRSQRLKKKIKKVKST